MPAFNNTKRGNFYLFDPYELVLIEDPTHHLYDNRVKLPVNESLVKSILYKNQGVIEPVVITKIDGKPVVVDGRQRTMAARVASEKMMAMGGPGLKIPCVNKRGSSEDLATMMVTANEQRRDDSPIEKAQKANSLINFGQSKQEVADVFGVTVQTLESYLELLDLDQETQKAVHTGKIKKSNAVAKRMTDGTRRRTRSRAEVAKMLVSVERGEQQMSAADALRWTLKEIEQ